MYLEGRRLQGLRILSEMGQSDLLQAAHALLIESGVSGPVRWLHDGEDEWVFIVDTCEAANMNDEQATRALMRLLGGKVWLTTDGTGMGATEYAAVARSSVYGPGTKIDAQTRVRKRRSKNRDLGASEEARWPIL